MVENEKNEGMDLQDRDEIYSKVVRAGKRTYFFDVKSTRREDYYLTITESKKVFDKDGHPHFEKHKIFLYKEDFEKFSEGFHDAVGYINTLRAQMGLSDDPHRDPDKAYSSVEFEDLEDSDK